MSSLFCPIVSDEEKKFFNAGTCTAKIYNKNVF